MESALVRLQPPGQQAVLGVRDPKDFLRFVGACFRQKRKTLRNNLLAFCGPEQAQAALADAGLDARARAEELGLDGFVRLYRDLSQAGHSVVGSPPL